MLTVVGEMVEAETAALEAKKRGSYMKLLTNEATSSGQN